MKSIIFALLGMSLNLMAYSSNPTVLKPGEVNIVRAEKGLNFFPGRVDVSLSVKTVGSELPYVKKLSRSEKCQHLQTLISYSGYDRVNNLYVREYEIQFLATMNNPSLPCQFIIESDYGFPQSQKTRVVILEN